MIRGQPLVPTVERVVQLTSATDLRNLEASGELDLATVLVTASDAVHDRLVTDGIDPAALLNAEVYERAVAFVFLGLLASQNHLSGQDAETLFATADRFYTEVRPRLRSGDEPRHAAEGLPQVRNVSLYRSGFQP